MMPLCELMTIVMIVDSKTNKVLLQERTKANWVGLAFPGGHVEPGEAFAEAAVREVQEEAGLLVTDLRLCGLVHWEDADTGERSIIACYRTESFSGALRVECEEGNHMWAPLSDLHTMKLAPWLDEQLSVFKDDAVSEIYYSHGKHGVYQTRTYAAGR